MRIELAKSAGFCFGVKRALELVEKNFGRMKKPIRMYGHLVHNEEVVKRLTAKGIEVIDALQGIYQGTLIITAHGISPKIKKELAARKELVLVDATCPKVLNVHSLAESLRREKRRVLIFGDPEHKEVAGIKGAAGGKAVVFSFLNELKKINISRKIKYGLIAQTTKEYRKFKELKKKIGLIAGDIKIFDTICPTSREKQSEAARLAKKHGAVLIIGSRLSANSKRLYEICSKINPNSYFINGVKELRKEWFSGLASVGVTAGASTPDWVIGEVVERVRKL